MFYHPVLCTNYLKPVDIIFRWVVAKARSTTRVKPNSRFQNDATSCFKPAVTKGIFTSKWTKGYLRIYAFVEAFQRPESEVQLYQALIKLVKEE